jgi:hypothetical protein
MSVTSGLPLISDAAFGPVHADPQRTAQRYRIYIRWLSRDAARAGYHRGSPLREPLGGPMSSRKLDELASDIDDAKTTANELQDDPDQPDRDEKLDDLNKTLENASDTIDELENKDDK